ncbi:MAG: MXAN_5187 C-terminal domain-containing protein [Polyangiales bacterium]
MQGEEIAALVDELEQRLERLRVLYDQFFMGIEKIPPSILQKDVERRIWILRREKIRNTGIRFKFQTMIQRYNTFTSYWMRIMREIENGTYKRDVLRAKRRFGADPNKPAQAAMLSQPPPPEEQEVELSLDDDDDLEALAAEAAAAISAPRAAPPRPPPPSKPQAAPPAPAPEMARKSEPRPEPSVAKRLPVPATVHPSVPKILAKKVETDDDLDDMLDEALGSGPIKVPAPRQPAPAPAPAQRPAHPFANPAPKPVARPAPAPAPATAKPQSAEEYRKVYAQYVDAKRKNGESTAGITYETLARSLDQTREKLKGKSGGKAIDFEVAVKDGKTILKPVVR